MIVRHFVKATTVQVSSLLPSKVIEETSKLFRRRISGEGSKKSVEVKVREVAVFVVGPAGARPAGEGTEEGVDQQSAHLLASLKTR